MAGNSLKNVGNSRFAMRGDSPPWKGCAAAALIGLFVVWPSMIMAAETALDAEIMVEPEAEAAKQAPASVWATAPPVFPEPSVQDVPAETRPSVLEWPQRRLRRPVKPPVSQRVEQASLEQVEPSTPQPAGHSVVEKLEQSAPEQSVLAQSAPQQIPPMSDVRVAQRVPIIQSEEARMAWQARADALIEWILEPEGVLEIDPRRSKIIRTRQPVTKVSVTDPNVLEIVQFGPSEFELIGGSTGQTSLTFWFGDSEDGGEILRYLVNVLPNEAIEDRRKIEYAALELKVNELFPDSMVQLIPIADKLIVRGQARDAEEAAQILALIRGQGPDTGWEYGGAIVNRGVAAEPFPGVSDLPQANVINLMHVTGEMQVLLKVRVAELNRSALREMGVDLVGTPGGEFTWSSLLGFASAVSAVLDTADVLLVMEAMATNSYSKILAEPNLVTLSGHSAAFLAGGEFPVPVVVGVEGAAAATTNFRSFGTQLVFTPTVLDKDRIRLDVAPSFSSINNENSVDGIPGLDTRAVSTTVDLREGQWLAIAGLLKDEQTGSSIRVPFIGDVPVLGTLFSSRDTKRDETELIVLVSPELLHPLEPCEAPSILPGMEVTDPSDLGFFVGGRIEGNPYRHYRSTVAGDLLRQCLDAHHQTKHGAYYQETESYYIQGSNGFSR